MGLAFDPAYQERRQVAFQVQLPFLEACPVASVVASLAALRREAVPSEALQVRHPAPVSGHRLA